MREPCSRPDGPSDDEVATHAVDGIIRFKNRYYIQASSALADDRNRVLKQGETFAVFDQYGDIKPIGLHEEGIYHEGTRHLSALILRLGRCRPMLLSSTIKEDNAVLEVDLTNPDIVSTEDTNRNGDDQGVEVTRGSLHVFRRTLLWEGVCYQRISVRNYGLMTVETSLALDFSADFVDIFEVRGTRRSRRGTLLDPVVEGGLARLGYRGLDGVTRWTTIAVRPAPAHIDGGHLELQVKLSPGEETTFDLTISCSSGDPSPPLLRFEDALGEADRAIDRLRRDAARVDSSNEAFNHWINRSYADIFMMVSPLPGGPYPYAGVPWFSTTFGRDGIITALECLWLYPELARGVLAFLASTQADAEIPEQDAEPGKILHEARGGEMAALGEIPFGRYYGSIDSTPLFVWLAAAYLERTGDLPFLQSLWPNIDRALRWIDDFGDRDGDGFVEYQRRTPNGLEQQGWKDSHDSVFHADGSAAEPPIALCEVQGYVYAAKFGASGIAQQLGLSGRAVELAEQAKALRDRFERAFWLDDLGTYALALDGRKRPCRVRSSNAGHCLATGIAAEAHAPIVAETLLSDRSFSGWGIRTLDAAEVRYNPMSYHNGSIWPHDNAMIAQGFARYGLRDAALRVLTGLFDASMFVDLQRLPELFCGFPRRPGTGPTLYPVACAPQAWAAASVFALLQAALGLRVKGHRNQVRFRYPILPEFLSQVRIRDLRVGQGRVDLILRRHHDQDVGVDIVRKDGPVEIAIVK
ncbi:amylo-alpha-1,6-glucosidase [Tautonia sociabilis]|uniref:Amylo-alpha-1,6-glucosidase n=1 Tax=Tautonia sociabilis TaxID=2080755 RepID=A0A432MKH5_9BACT|nr:glycogen debranching N-terminal domain-containing protein [Tautonia sociabilis]RUL87770.1 amylo-alpha-1,6-glucosidase [Tautonia sociabilis]